MDLRCKDGYILCNSSATDVHIGSFIVSFSSFFFDIFSFWRKLNYYCYQLLPFSR